MASRLRDPDRLRARDLDHEARANALAAAKKAERAEEATLDEIERRRQDLAEHGAQTNAEPLHTMLPALTLDGVQSTPSEDDPLLALTRLIALPSPLPAPLPAYPVPPIAQHAGVAVAKCGAATADAIAQLKQQVRADADELIEFLDLLENDVRSRTSLAVELVERFGSDARRTRDIAHGLRSKDLLP